MIKLYKLKKELLEFMFCNPDDIKSVSFKYILFYSQHSFWSTYLLSLNINSALKPAIYPCLCI